MKRLSEEQLAAAVVAWLREMDWEVYQEVECAGSRCDIVATHGPLVWAIECKVSMSLAVITQAMSWRDRANRVSVATGWFRDSHSVEPMLRELRLGAFRVTHDAYSGETKAMEAIYAPLVRPRRNSARRPLRDALREEQKTYAPAGNASSSFWSPWKATCKAVRDFVTGRAEPATMKEIVDGIKHHYASPASARCSLAQWIEAGKIEGVRARREGRRLLVEAAP